MEEPVRLACPQCELVYRLKRYTPGKVYTCKNCGGPLAKAEELTPDDHGAPPPEPTESESEPPPPPSELPQLRHPVTLSFVRPPSPSPSPMFDNSGDLAHGRSGIAAGLAPESGLARLPRLIEELTGRLDVLKDLELSEGEEGPAAKLLAMNGRLEGELRGFKDAVESRLGELADRVAGDMRENHREVDELRSGLADLDSRLASALDDKFKDIRLELGDRLGDLNHSFYGIMEKAEKADSSQGIDAIGHGLGELKDELKKELGEQGRLLSARLDEHQAEQARRFDAFRGEHREALEEHRDAQKQELAALSEAQKKELEKELDAHRHEQRQAMESLVAPSGEVAPNTTVEVDIDELADRLVAGLRGSHSKFVDPESGLAMDAMARLADELVKEQSANTAKLDHLAEEIRTATAGISKLDEWRGDLPGRVADEIGQTVEARVVGPISGALAKQAPSILSDLQDNKLVDIVSRSVREAQRPLLREILSGRRGGVPLWLFASILLPLLLILGYLFLPGELTRRSSDPEIRQVSESLSRLESTGLPISADDEDRLRTIEEAVLDIHAEALAHVRNATALEAENRSLKAMIAERDQLMNEYKETLQTQVQRLREYEMRLVQLGVSPKAVGE